MKKNILLVIFQLTALFLFGSVLYAQEESKSQASAEMSSPQAESPSEDTYRENLKRWQSLSEKERRLIRERARRLDPGEIRELRKESLKLRNMPKEEQERIRANYQRFNRFPLKEREVLKERYRRFEKLPSERREEFRRRFRERRSALSAGQYKENVRIPKSERPADFKENIRTHRKDIRKRPEYRKNDSQRNKGMPRAGIRGPRGCGHRK